MYPEYIQDAATPAALAKELRASVQDSGRRDRTAAQAARLRALLTVPASGTAAGGSCQLGDQPARCKRNAGVTPIAQNRRRVCDCFAVMAGPCPGYYRDPSEPRRAVDCLVFGVRCPSRLDFPRERN
jgi:hypothetical protein